ncbi:MAG TPA: serine hydrolase domain-containing protein [Jatrophihabitantaceae bacterium]|nr:serine hydrolase domain-containing protein [Jatrophihabitantaceae bacterium]
MADVGGTLAADLERRVRDKQREWRAPSVIAGLVRDGELSWSLGVGAADVARPDDAPGPDTAFAIGSISKTFTASLIMALRDDGKLALTDPVSRYVDVPAHGGLTLRELLAHASGLQREPVGDLWETLVVPSIADVVRDLAEAEAVLPPRRRWHYSNLAYSLLGEVAARVDGRPWADSVQARLLEPLGLTRTGLAPASPAAIGYYTDPFTDQVHPEKWPDMGGFSSAGGLWSTLSDLTRWVSFLATGADGVLAASTLEEMTRPEIMADLDSWTLAWGLGLELLRRGDRIMVGHEGAMPGFLACVAIRRVDRVGAVVLCNTSAAADPATLVLDLIEASLDAEPPAVEPWRPGPPVPAELAPLVGRWWSEGSSFTFTVADGHLEARKDGQPATKAPAVFELIGPDRYRAVSGREEGEQLLVERDSSGSVTRMKWATYPFTRDPRTFGA